ncbi:Disease resistance protein [Artemisia annua]|uniref:Disease resistance protein n=1 Tax=Artemisia annua TaxID=35608 RepID=A0A2U1MH33_ARTAN|nr:Disease resistance protein [Artemisia annua]
MAEIVVSAVVNVLVEKLISGDLIKLARSERINSQLKKWKDSLQLIQAVLADAGQKHITQRPVELWLLKLQDLAYDIDDVLDDMDTEALRRKLNQESQTSTCTSKVLKIIPTCCTNYTPHNIMYGRKISSKLDEITNKLHDLVEEKNNLGLDVNVKVERSRRLEETSLVDKSSVLGREGDKEALLEKLLVDESKVSVVSIVGMGGIGKTTLAKVLYNDEKVEAYFDLRAWVCVSEEFDVFTISKAVFQAVTGENKKFANLDLLQVALKEKLSRKKFLVVLDDVWNENHDVWERLKSPLVDGAPGSKIIVTTRKTKVASVMNSFEPCNLGVLSNDSALSLFARCALDEPNFDKHPPLKDIAQGIIDKCARLPLALVTLGRVLKTKQGNEGDWEELLNSEIWNLPEESDVLPALKLSYYDLPPDLKQVFAYCSLFPKDHLFDKNKLVLLWMAQGFLSQSVGNKSMEGLGCHYFEELKSRSFFQHSANDVSLYTMHDLMNDLAVSVAGESFFQHSANDVSLYTMHDLMNDLAVSVAGEFNFMLDDKTDVNGRTEVFEKLRHFSFVSQENLVYRKFKELHRAKRLRTFLSVGWGVSVDYIIVELMPQLKFLRVLSLTNGLIEEVPQSIGSLIHLRYLNFSNTCIKQIPEQVSDLYNLQSLLVRGCRSLSTLPVSFEKLINLRHLDISGTPRLKKMPLGIGGLTSLQTLPKVCIEGANGFQISELKDLSELQGRLAIEGLDKVIDPTQATDASLQQKKGIDDLDLEWSDNFDDRNSTVEYEVLERLRPYCKLRKLKILFYGGLKFPSWVGDSSFDQLTELVLEDCRNCTHLPTLGQLSSLRKLFVKRMHEVKTVGPFKGIALPSLESLEVVDMQGLEMWSTDISFPRLQKISIEECPKLDKVSIGSLPSLNTLHIPQCCEPVFKSIACMSSSISSLTLWDIKGLTQLQGEVLKHLGAVEWLDIVSCDELRYLWESESVACTFLVSLRWLFVKGCESLVSLAEKEVNVGSSMDSVREVRLIDCKALENYNCPNNVERLTIESCSSMSCLTFSNSHKLPSSPMILDIPDKGSDYLRPFPSFCLKYLYIDECENLNSFPHEHLQSLTSLEDMNICDCPNMDYSFPCGLWPPNLKKLTIGCLKKPMSEWGLQNYPTSLVTLELFGKDSGVVSFEVEENASNATSKSFLLPSSLTSLSIKGFKKVESFSEVLKHLTRLEVLVVYFCPEIRDLPESSSSLRVIIISCRTVARIIEKMASDRVEKASDRNRAVLTASDGRKCSDSRLMAVVNVLLEKLISGDLMKLARSEGIDSQLKKWKNSCN